MLSTSGPLLVKGKIGIGYYQPGTEKYLNTVSGLQIFGWDKKDYIESIENIHAVVVIGVHYNAETPSNSRVLFLDPQQTLDPYQTNKKVYSISFSKFISIVESVYTSSDYRLTKDVMAIEDELTKHQSSLKSGFFTNTANKPESINYHSSGPDRGLK